MNEYATFIIHNYHRKVWILPVHRILRTVSSGHRDGGAHLMRGRRGRVGMNNRVTIIALGIGILAVAVCLFSRDADQRGGELPQEPERLPVATPGLITQPSAAPKAASNAAPAEAETPEAPVTQADPALETVVTVVRPDGAPASAAIVRYASARKSRAAGLEETGVQSITAGEDGVARIVFPEPAPPGPVHVAATSSDGTLVSTDGLDLEFGEQGVLRLASGATIEGRVIAAPSAEGIYVYAYSPFWAEAPGSRRIEVDGEGRFTVPGVVGRVNLIAYAPGRLPSPLWKSKKVTPGETRQAVLQLGGSAVTGRVRLVVGEATVPPPGTPVLYSSGGSGWSGAACDESGVVTLPFLSAQPDANASILVYPIMDTSGHALSLRLQTTVKASAWAGAEPATLTLPGCGTLEFVDAQDKPLSGLKLMVIAQAGGEQLGAKFATTDSVGRIALTRTAAARLRVTTMSEDELWQGEPPGPGKTLRIVVRTLRCVTVKLLDWEKRPVSCYWIGAAVVDGPDDARSRGDKGFLSLGPPDWFRFKDSHTLTLCFDPEEVRDPVVRVKVRGVESVTFPIGRDRSVEAVLSKLSGAVQGRGADAAGRTIPTVLQLKRDANPHLGYLARLEGAEGSTLVGLKPGRYSWKARRTSTPSWEKEGEVVVTAGNTLDLKITW